MNRRTLLIIMVVALLLSLSNWLMEKTKMPGLLPPVVSEERPDYFINGLVAVETNEQGKLSQRVEAAHLAHMPDTNVSLLEQPRLEVFRDNKVEWRAESREGQIFGQQELLLSGNVELRQPGAKVPVWLNTESLRLFPQRHYAETDQAVVLRRGNSRVDGTGLELYGDEQRLVLLSKVRGHHENLAY